MSLDELLKKALEEHRLGHRDVAESLYRKILAADPRIRTLCIISACFAINTAKWHRRSI